MSGRIRTIKPELLEDEVVIGLSHEAFRLFIAMVLLADDHGNLRASDRLLHQVLQGPGLPPGRTIADLRSELGRKLVLFYEVNGQAYAHLTGWGKHQRIDNATAPRVPLPPGWTLSTRDVCNKKTGERLRTIFESHRPPVADVAEPTGTFGQVPVATPPLKDRPQVETPRLSDQPQVGTPQPTRSAPLDLDLDVDPDVDVEQDREQEGTNLGDDGTQPPPTSVPADRASWPASQPKVDASPKQTALPAALEDRRRIVTVLQDCPELDGHIEDFEVFARALQGQAGFRRPDDAPLDEITHYACIQLTTEVSQGKHKRAGLRAGVLRGIFRRLLNPEELARARGDDAGSFAGNRPTTKRATEMSGDEYNDALRRSIGQPISADEEIMRATFGRSLAEGAA